MPQEPVKIVIVVDGGVVQDVLTAGVPVEYVLVDYDTDGDDEAVPVLQPNGEFIDAFVTKSEAVPDGNEVAALFTIADSEGL